MFICKIYYENVVYAYFLLAFFIDGYSISKVNLYKELAVRSIVYSQIFFKEINSDASFYVPEHCQYDLPYWLLYPELFLYWRVSVSFHGLSFQLRLTVSNPLLVHL